MTEHYTVLTSKQGRNIIDAFLDIAEFDTQSVNDDTTWTFEYSFSSQLELRELIKRFRILALNKEAQTVDYAVCFIGEEIELFDKAY